MGGRPFVGAENFPARRAESIGLRFDRPELSVVGELQD